MSNSLKWELHPAGTHVTARTEKFGYYVHKNLFDDKYYALAIHHPLPTVESPDGTIFQAMKWAQDHYDQVVQEVALGNVIASQEPPLSVVVFGEVQ